MIVEKFHLFCLRLRQLDGHIRGQGQFGLDIHCLDDTYRHGTGGIGTVQVSEIFVLAITEVHHPPCLKNTRVCFHAVSKKKPNNNKAMIETAIS
jgi:hypothetical protein